MLLSYCILVNQTSVSSSFLAGAHLTTSCLLAGVVWCLTKWYSVLCFGLGYWRRTIGWLEKGVFLCSSLPNNVISLTCIVQSIHSHQQFIFRTGSHCLAKRAVKKLTHFLQCLFIIPLSLFCFLINPSTDIRFVSQCWNLCRDGVIPLSKQVLKRTSFSSLNIKLLQHRMKYIIDYERNLWAANSSKVLASNVSYLIWRNGIFGMSMMLMMQGMQARFSTFPSKVMRIYSNMLRGTVAMRWFDEIFASRRYNSYTTIWCLSICARWNWTLCWNSI